MAEPGAPTRYALPQEFHEFERDDMYLFFDPVSFVWFQTDRLGKGVLDGLMAGGSLESAATEVARLTDLPHETAVTYSRNTLEQLVAIGFAHEGSYQPRRFPEHPLRVPLILYVHMTPRCNLKCPYCYNQENRHQIWKTPVVSFEDYCRVLDEAAELGFQEIKLTGGEALLNPDTLRLARYAREKGLYVNLLTNATLIDEEKAREIVDSIDTISISLDSPHAHEHDAMRGKNTWVKVMNAIRLLRKAGLRNLHLNSVVTPANLGSVEEFLAFATEELKARKVTLAPTGIDVPDPTGKWGAKDTMITMDDMWQIYASQRAYIQKRTAGRPIPVSRDALRRNQCGVGNGLVSLESNGDVYPCQTMHLPEMKCGNVFETSLREIIETSPVLDKMRNLRVERLEDCPTCPMRYICSGGCRMEAYSREGRPEARNRDMCPFFFTRSLNKLWDAANVPATEADQQPETFGDAMDYFASYV